MSDKIVLTVVKRPDSKNKSMRICVDDLSEPGTPAVGYGESLAEAIGNWVIGNAERHNIRIKPETTST